MEKILKLKNILEITGSVLLITCGLIILVKIIKAKYDKNKNNKLETEEKEEMLKDNYNYVMSFLGDSLKCIVKGIVQDTGCKIITAEKLILKAMNDLTKQNENLDEELNKEKEEILKYEEQQKADLALQAEMLKKQRLEMKIVEENNKLKGGTSEELL